MDLVFCQRACVSYLNQGNTQPARLALTSVHLQASTNPVEAGQTTSLTATVTAATGSGTPSGTVTFWNDGVVLATVNVTNGKAGAVRAYVRHPTRAARGFRGVQRQLYVCFFRLQRAACSGQGIAIPTQTFLLTNPYQVAEGSPEVLTASVIPGVGPGTPTGKVSFSASPDGSSQTIPLATVALNNGRAVLTATVPVGFPAGHIPDRCQLSGGADCTERQPR